MNPFIDCFRLSMRTPEKITETANQTPYTLGHSRDSTGTYVLARAYGRAGDRAKRHRISTT